MRKIASFTMLSVDGYFERSDPWSIDWHTVDGEFNEFARRQLEASDLLVFGRKTYLGMAQYWPSPEGIRDDPVVASLMNTTPKAVVSRTLSEQEVTWANARLVRDLDEMSRLKQEDGKEILVLGSSILTAGLLDRGLLDELRVMVSPIVLGTGNSFAQNPSHSHKLRLLGTRQFGNGNLLVTYAPDAA
jgi:dihydrofolate reductase